MKDKISVDGCEHVLASLDAYRGELANFTDLSAHRVPSFGTRACMQPEAPKECACASAQPLPVSKRSNGKAQTQDGSAFLSDKEHSNRSRARRTLGAIGGISHEFCLDDHDDDDCARRESRLRKLKIVDDLVLVCGGGPTELPTELPSSMSPNWTPRPQADHHNGPAPRPSSTAEHNAPGPRAYALQLMVPTKHASDWAFRVTRGGRCHHDARVFDAYDLAYQTIRFAERELDHWAEMDMDTRRFLWQRGQLTADEGARRATLGYWFGAADSPNFSKRFTDVHQTIRDWSHCFRHGFYGHGIHRPVYIRCHPNEPNEASAYHAEPNVITLCPGWYEQGPKNRAMVILHEMGHYSGRAVPLVSFHWSMTGWVGLVFNPRDRKNDICSKWQGQRRCYQGDIPHAQPQMYIGGDPKRLANLFDDGDQNAEADMLGNIDNYVSYLWNRWQDRNYGWLKLLRNW